MSTLTYEPAWNSVLKFIHFREERDYTRVDWKALYLAVLRLGHDARSHLNLLPDLRGRGDGGGGMGEGEGGGEGESDITDLRAQSYIMYCSDKYA